jgi:hypothetical protein
MLQDILWEHELPRFNPMEETSVLDWETPVPDMRETVVDHDDFPVSWYQGVSINCGL